MSAVTASAINLRVSSGVAAVCSQPCSRRSCCECVGVAAAQDVEGVAVVGVDLSPVDGQSRRREGSGVGAGGDLGCDPAGFDRRRLLRVAEHPQLTAGAGVDGGEDIVGVAGRGL